MTDPDAITAALLELHATGPSAVALFGADDHLRWANAAFRRVFALSDEAAPGWAALLRTLGVAERRRRVPERGYAADLNDGRWFWVSETLREDGQLLCVVADISMLRAAPKPPARSEDRGASKPNRGAALRQLQRALSNGADWPLTVALLQCDSAVLATEMMLGALRRDDACARLGKAELLILSSTAIPQAEVIVQRLLERLRGAGSVGVAATLVEAEWGEDAETLLRRLEDASKTDSAS